jgi:hypothetical protein
MTIARIGATLLISISTTLLLAACGGGGGGGVSSGSKPITNNFSAKSLQVVTPDPRIAYPLTVSASIEADNPADNVSVPLFAIDKNTDPTAEVRQIPLGTQTIPQVDAGTHSYDLDVNIPSSVETPGSYYIAATIDPVDEVGETDEAVDALAFEPRIDRASAASGGAACQFLSS